MKKEEKRIPFFAKFLENQLKKEDDVKGGSGSITTPLGDVPVTLKYPSDSDEITSNKNDIAVTLKYPSDGDEVTSPKLDNY